jgi:serine/threonine protein kinase
MLKPDSAEDGTFAERFNREARTMARLSHPQIVGVHDFGEVQSLINSDTSEGLPRRLYYILMEYVEGENLRQTMQRGGIEPTRVISIITQVCAALQFAHQEGVIHRDIKPENILIDKRGAVKIADFGLAKLATPSEHDFTLTGTHQVMGTPRYMAPEQMAGSREVDRRADIYALGVVFYEMLTGDIPAGHFSPPSEQSDLDPRFDEILMRMLANRPENRFANAEEILQALQSEGTLPFPVVSSPAHSRMGVSTIMERGVAAAWDWMRATPASESSSKTEESSTSDRNSAVPMLMAVLCLLGVMLIPAPWMVVNITDPDFVRGLKVDQTSVVQSRTTYQMVKSEIEYWSGLATMGALIGLLVSIFAFPSGRTASRWKPIVMTTFSVLALISVGAFWMEVERTRLEYRYVPDPKSKIFSLEKTLFHGVSDLEHHSDLQPAYLLCLGMAGIALLLSAREIGQVTTNAGSTSKTKPEVEEEKEFWSKTPITSLRFPIPQNGEIASKIAFHFRGIGYEMTEELPDCWIFERGALMGGLVQSDIRAYPTRLTVQAIDVEDQSRMISCHWSVKTMGSGSGKKEIRRLENEARDLQRLLGAEISEAAEREADLVAIEEEVGGVSLSLIIVGVLTVIGHLVFMIVSILQSSQAVLPWLTLPGLFSSVLVLVAGFHLQSLRSRTWVQVGVIAGMLPVTPTWVLSVGFCIWGLMAISDPEVKHAFLTKRRRRAVDQQWRRTNGTFIIHLEEAHVKQFCQPFPLIREAKTHQTRLLR